MTSSPDSSPITSPCLYLVDSSIYIFRAYFSMPDRFFDSKERPINAVYGFTHFLLDLLLHSDLQQDFVGLAFDESLDTGFRHQLYPDYKANRALPDEDLAYQLQLCYELAEGLGLYCVASEEYEADDLIASMHQKFALGKRYQGKLANCCIVTRDKDLAQLIQGSDQLWDFAKNEFWSQQALTETWGFSTEFISDFLAIAGDSVDNIPGVPGVGKKTATELIARFSGIDRLYQEIDDIAALKGLRGASKLQEKLQNYESEVRLYHQLTQLASKAPLSGGLSSLKLSTNLDLDWLEKKLEKIGIRRGFAKKLKLLSSA